MKKLKLILFNHKSMFAILVLVCISLITIGYSALNSTLTISGTATARAKSDIRVTAVKSTRLDNGAYETTSPKFTKYTTQMNSTLPNPSSIIEYSVTIKNYSDKQYELTDIERQLESNPDMTLVIEGLSAGKIFEPGEEVTFIVKEMYTTGQGESKEETIILKYNFIEYVPDPEEDEGGESGPTTLLRDKILSDNGGVDIISGKDAPDFTAVTTSNDGMYSAEDDSGTTYYYRGAVDNNYVLFAGFYWRIIRISGDNSIKLIYQGTTADASGSDSIVGSSAYNTLLSGYSSSNRTGVIYTNGSDSTIKSALEKWYGNNLVDDDDYIYKDTKFYEDWKHASSTILWIGASDSIELKNNAAAFAAQYRLSSTKTPTYKFENNSVHTAETASDGDKYLKYPVGFITMDEAYYAGGFTKTNTSYYLYSNVAYWTMSPYGMNKSNGAQVTNVAADGKLTGTYVTSSLGMRPVIALIPDVKWGGGDGTASNPYIPSLGVTSTEKKVDPTPYYTKTLSEALTGMSSSGDTTILKHTSDLENSASDDSYRYSGANPNNYVCFGDSNYTGSSGSSCSINNLYRIIGLIDGNVKLITADYLTTDMLGTDGAYISTLSSLSSTYRGNRTASEIAKYAYTLVQDSDEAEDDTGVAPYAITTYENDWNDTSSLAYVNLNQNFLNSFGSDWKSKILKTTWHVGDVNYFSAIEEQAKKVMDRELNSDATYSNYIGLMYYHEYAFAASKNTWKYTMNSYSNYTKRNWMFLGEKEWTISHGSYTILLSKITSYASSVSTSGAPSYERVNNGLPIRATFNIDSSVKLKSGLGTYDNPYALDIS